MLAYLSTVPQDQQDWSIWSFQNYTVINAINQAVFAQKQIILPNYQIEPIPWNDLTLWLQNNQQAHIDFTAALGQQSNDIFHTNWQDPAELQAWIFLNFMELYNACATLKIGP